MMCCSRAVAVLLCWGLAVCFQTARAGTNVCVFQTGEWEISMSINADRILLREPVRLKIECRNITREAQMALPDIRVILVSREGWQQNYLLYYNELFDIMDREPEEAIWVEPGAKETREYWLLLGTPVQRSEGYPKKLEFLFGTPGKYQIGLAQYQDQNARVDVEVIAPTSREDLAACNMVSVSAAKLFLHSADPQTFRSAFIDVVKEGSGAIQAICDHFSSSTYAPYAALAMADITRGTNNPPANNQPAKGKVVLSVSKLKPATLKMDGFDNIPAAPRAILESYWKALAELRLNDAEMHLHSEFTGYLGGRQDWRTSWEDIRDDTQIDVIEVVVARANMVTSYSVSPERNAKATMWTGELCVVESQYRWSITDRVSGEKTIVPPLPAVKMVLIKEGKAWKILNEYMEPTRNQIAGRLVQDLSLLLNRSLTTVRMQSDNDSVLVVDKIRAILPSISKEIKLVWQGSRVEMTGENYDQPVLWGDILKGDDTNEEKTQKRFSCIKVITKLLGAELVLVGVEVVE